MVRLRRAGDAKGSRRRDRRAVLLFLSLAAALHVALAVTLFAAGHFRLLPGLLDEQGLFTPDSRLYRAEALALATEARARGTAAAWEASAAPLPVRLSALQFRLFGGWLGETILALEPGNLLGYLAVLLLVRELARAVGEGGRGALLAAAVVGLWPSFILHTTQLLRDPLIIVALLGLILAVAKALGDARRRDPRREIGAGLAGGAAVMLLWSLRSEMWPVALLVALLGVAARVLLSTRERSRRGMGAVSLILILTLATPLLVEPYRRVAPVEPRAETGERAERACPRRTFLAKLAWRRQQFAAQYGDAGSNLDAEVRFDDLFALLRYLPRALVIGLCAPFPAAWFERGAQVGAAGRWLGGLEMSATYVVELLALVGLYARRRCLIAWLLFIVAVAGAAALGLVVANVGALYRLRYPFWTLLVILGGAGARELSARWRQLPGPGADAEVCAAAREHGA